MDKRQPQQCNKCRKIKEPGLGKFYKQRGKFDSWYWICTNCQCQKGSFKRNRRRRPSHAEKMAIPALLESGYYFEQEYNLGRFWYDFAVPKLRLLIEVDSKSYHSAPRRKSIDRAKTKLAEEEGWALARVTYSRNIHNRISKVLIDREIAVDF